MSDPAGSDLPSPPDEALALLALLDQISLDRYAIVGTYLRFDDRTRHALKELRQKVTAAYHARSVDPRNFLLWGAPGSGKSYLVQQIAAPLRDSVHYRELNLAQLDQGSFRAGLESVVGLGPPVLCLVDEVDAKPDASWPYEILLPYLEPATARSHRVCFCLAGSGGRNLADLKDAIRARPKGPDLLSRISVDNEFSIPPLGAGDRILVAIVQLMMSASAEGHRVREIEKLALYYIATQTAFASARQLRGLASQGAQRIPPGEDRVKYDHLFPPGDPENKGFWLRSEAARLRLGDRFLAIDPGAQLEGGPTGAPSSPVPAGPTPLEPSRIIVLPFANISPDPADEYFADGMTEEVIERLAHVGGLRVIARTTSMHYKGSRETALDIGRALRAGTVVECSVRKSGGRIRITAQLIDTNTEEHLWSSRYDRELADVFAIQDDISEQITSSISSLLLAGGARAPLPYVHVPQDTKDLTAYTHYLRGVRILGEKGSEATLREALAQFETAVARDPEFARARVGVAETVLWLSGEGALPLEESVRRSRRELERAIELDGALGEAHSALSGLLLTEDDLVNSEKEARRAIELNSSLSDPYRWLAQIDAGVGKIEESVRWLEAAQQINPVDVNVIAFLGRAYVYAGREADALRHWATTRAIAPFRTSAHEAEFYLGQGNYDRAEVAIREMERLRPASVWVETYRGILAAGRGNVDEARACIGRLDQRGATGELTVFFSGFIQYALGEQDAFLAAMEEADRRHALPQLELMYSRLYEPIRGDPRIQKMLQAHIELRSRAG